MLAVVALGSGFLVGLLIALLVAFLIYVVGVYLFHAPPTVVGILALIVFLILLFAGGFG